MDRHPSDKNFGRLKGMFKKKGRNEKAMAELDASKDPIGFAKRNIEPSLKGKKGIAI